MSPYKALLTVSVLLILGCHKGPDPKRLGIFADTERGLIELTSYGEEIGIDTYRAPKLEFPNAHEVRALFMNMPDTNISSAQLLWAESLRDSLREGDTSHLSMQTEVVEGSLYRIQIQNQPNTTGILILKVGMPMGTADRIYPIKIEH
jgi:hypothetical protein